MLNYSLTYYIMIKTFLNIWSIFLWVMVYLASYASYRMTINAICRYNAKHNSSDCRTNNTRGASQSCKSERLQYSCSTRPTYCLTSLRNNPHILNIFVSNTPSYIFLTASNLLELSSKRYFWLSVLLQQFAHLHLNFFSRTPIGINFMT